MNQRTIVARKPEEAYGPPLEVLVIFDGTNVHVATREATWHSWGPPLDIVSDETDRRSA